MTRRKCCNTVRRDEPHLPTCNHAQTEASSETPEAFRKNHKKPCCICGDRPTVGTTELCGPHCFGEAETAGGNW
jgi:hypothetical protein